MPANGRLSYSVDSETVDPFITCPELHFNKLQLVKYTKGASVNGYVLSVMNVLVLSFNCMQVQSKVLITYVVV